MTALELTGVSKRFVMHLQDGLQLPVLRNVSFKAGSGQCVALSGPSGTGKSSILKLIYGNYRCDEGSICVSDDSFKIDIASASPRQILSAREHCIGYVTQFLRAVPRVSALDIVSEPLIRQAITRDEARVRAGDMLRRFNLPERLWTLPPATFSGGEQQRVNLARGLVGTQPILLLDEPTASLDAQNCRVVIDIINERKAGGCAVVAIVHDDEVRDAIADAAIDVIQFATGGLI